MHITSINDKLFTQEFCFGDCHLLADICHYRFSELANPVKLYTCYDLTKRHSFVSIEMHGETYYLDGSGIHTTMQSVFFKYGIHMQSDFDQLSIEEIMPDDHKFVDLVKQSYRYQKIAGYGLADDTEEEFFQEQCKVMDKYLNLIHWPVFSKLKLTPGIKEERPRIRR